MLGQHLCEYTDRLLPPNALLVQRDVDGLARGFDVGDVQDVGAVLGIDDNTPLGQMQHLMIRSQ